MTAREYNRRIKQAIAALKAAGAQRVAVEIAEDGTARVVEAQADAGDDEAATSGVTGRAFTQANQRPFRKSTTRNDARSTGRTASVFGTVHADLILASGPLTPFHQS